jgi:hypothetical protein
MAITGAMLKGLINLWATIKETNNHGFSELQVKELRKLIEKARKTEFGRKYKFADILSSDDKDIYHIFKETVPILDYYKINDNWWKKSRQGKIDVCWPGKIEYFATSSGTTDAASKYIPLTDDMLRAIETTGINQLLTLYKYDLPASFFETEVLILGGCTDLNYNGYFYEGDMSGIKVSRLPQWFEKFFRPGHKISSIRNWPDKIDAIVREAKEWNVGVLMGIPAWNLILIEKIIEYYKVETIHDIWPELKIFVHGGVAIDSYQNSFQKLMKHPIIYIETYLASEGFIAYQDEPEKKSMKMVADNGLFYEFIEFSESNFTHDGDLKKDATTTVFEEIKEGTDYALLISTCAGCWRYLIGDVIKFTSKEKAEILITGRTKHFMSLCGEHLSVDNMNEAIRLVSEELDITINEYTVMGIPSKSLFAHKWFIGTDDIVSSGFLKEKLDHTLKILNKDYNTRRSLTLQDPSVEVLKTEVFIKWLQKQGKEGAQNKFPRVLTGPKQEDWLEFLQQEKVLTSEELIFTR